MEIEYKRDLTSTTMIISGIAPLSGYRARIIEENNVPCLLRHNIINSGGYNYRYDISGKKSLRGFFIQEGISLNSLLKGFTAILKALSILEDFLLIPGEILLDIDRVFLKNNGYEAEAYFVYTGSASCYDEGLLSIMEYIIENIDNKENGTVSLCYRLYERASLGSLTIGEIVESISEAYREDEGISYGDEDLWDKEEQTPSLAEHTGNADEGFFKEEAECFKEDMEKGNILKAFFSKILHKFYLRKNELFPRVVDVNDFILDPESEEEYIEPQTVLISGAEFKSRALIYLGRENYEDIDIDKNVMKIGSRASACDFVIDTKAVSRVHAVISIENENYYIQDMESKNGTYVNENILPPNTRTPLNIGDIVSFANISYRFS